MKHLAILFICLGCSASLFGQKLFRLNNVEDQVIFKTVVQNHALAIEIQPESPATKKPGGFPKILNISIVESDLVLEYQPEKGSEPSSYKFELSLQLPDGELIVLREEDQLDRAVPGRPTRQITWPDAAEWVPSGPHVYTLVINRFIMGSVNCEAERPTFSLRQKIPYYATGGAGLVMIGLGQVYRNQKNDYYALYQQRWQAGEAAPENKSDDLRQKALNKNRSAKICTWAGIGLLAVDGLLFAKKIFKTNKKKQFYDKHCAPESNLQLKSNGQQIGLLYNF